jgi:hypothetical protein
MSTWWNVWHRAQMIVISLHTSCMCEMLVRLSHIRLTLISQFFLCYFCLYWLAVTRSPTQPSGFIMKPLFWPRIFIPIRAYYPVCPGSGSNNYTKTRDHHIRNDKLTCVTTQCFINTETHIIMVNTSLMNTSVRRRSPRKIYRGNQPSKGNYHTLGEWSLFVPVN